MWEFQINMYAEFILTNVFEAYFFIHKSRDRRFNVFSRATEGIFEEYRILIHEFIWPLRTNDGDDSYLEFMWENLFFMKFWYKRHPTWHISLIEYVNHIQRTGLWLGN